MYAGSAYLQSPTKAKTPVLATNEFSSCVSALQLYLSSNRKCLPDNIIAG